MNTAATNAITNSAIATESSSTSRRLWRGVLAATSVALVGAAVMPAAQAEAAGVKATNYAVVSPAPATRVVSPTDLPRSDGRSITYRVSQDGTLTAV